ncbi:hypothetical protein AB0M47_12240 [Hamadaea sp. NPDC051192]|uniref:hypothetical protein n=1 Tax=Hamadaea sp. NPDC051192 TaxID=3154940 RepID=UPI0034290DC3
MSRDRLRLAAVSLGLLAFALRIVVAFWWQPLTWSLDSLALGIGLYAVGMITAAVLPFGGYWLLTRRYRLPRAFPVQDGRFVARSNPILFGLWSILLLYFAGGMVPARRVPNEYVLRLNTDPLPLFLVAATLVAALVVIGVALPFLLGLGSSWARTAY